MRTFSFVVLVMLIASGGLWAAEQPAGQPAMPPYPRVNMAPWYEVDPSWPQRPADVNWGDVPGVAVDGQDQVWVFTCALPPVQVYAADGKFIRSWGSDTIDKAHFLRFDAEGRVWVTDVGKHVVMQFTPEGKLLRTLGTPGEPGEDATHFDKPTDVAVTAQATSTWRTVTATIGLCSSIATASSSAPGAHWGSSRASSVCRTALPWTPRAGSTWPIETTSASRSSTPKAAFWRNGGT